MSISVPLRRCVLAAAAALLCAPYAHATRAFIDFGEGNFALSGNFFPLSDSHDVDVDPNKSVGPIALPFGLDFGSGTVYNSFFLNENGAITFGTALPDGTFTSVTNLANLGVPVIAPYYSDLLAAPTDGDDSNIIPGQVFYSSGTADPLPNSSGEYSPDETVSAVRVTWFQIKSAADPSATIFTQLYLYAAGGNDFDIRLSYGDPDFAGGGVTPALDALAGFSLGDFAAAVTAPFLLTTDYFYSFRGGKLVDATTPPTTVPEPPVALLAALGLAGIALCAVPRRRRTNR